MDKKPRRPTCLQHSPKGVRSGVSSLTRIVLRRVPPLDRAAHAEMPTPQYPQGVFDESFLAGGAAAELLPGATVEQRIWNSALALVS